MLATALLHIAQAPASAPASPPAPLGTGGADGPDSFARLLNQADDAQRDAGDEAAGDTPPPANTAGPRGPAAQRGCTRPCNAPGSKGTVTGTPKTEDMPQDTPAGTDAQGTDTAVDESAATDTAALLAGLAALSRPPVPPTPPAGDAGARGVSGQGLGRDGATSESTGRAASAGAPGGEAALPVTAATASGPTRTPAGAGTATGAMASTTPFATLMASSTAAQAARSAAGEPVLVAAESPAARAEAVNTAAAPLPLPALAATAPGATASAPAEARLPASPGSPEFANQLGAQLSTFVRAGVQHARLELHPIELGPVTVQIQLDGGNAQVSFAAEHAQTRHALEQALPALAGSLREAGLTLSGGGVFEQPRQPQPGGGQGAASGRTLGAGAPGGVDTAAGTTLPAAPLRRRGVVDLVA